LIQCRNINCSSDNKQCIYREIVPPAEKVCIRDQSDCNENESIEIKPAKHFITELKCKHRLSDAAVEDIAVMLRQLIYDVPKTAKSILEKSREPLKDESFLHIGLTKCLTNIIERGGIETNIETLLLQFGVGGIPITGNVSFWPVMVIIVNTSDSSPVTVSVYCGKLSSGSKPPNVDEFLNPCI